MKKAPLSGKPAVLSRDGEDPMVQGPQEGTYWADENALDDLYELSKRSRAKLLVAVRQANERGQVLTLRWDNLDFIVDRVPDHDEDSLLAAVLRLVASRSLGIGTWGRLNVSDYPVAGCLSVSEFKWGVDRAIEAGLLEAPEDKLWVRYTTGEAATVRVTSSGRRFLAEQQPSDQVSPETQPIPTVQADSMVKVFISHSHTDHKLATAVYDLLVASLGLTAADLRATSVRGAKLPAGTEHAPAIRQEVREATVCVGLITPNSMASDWAIFEMGARWGLDGAEKLFVPMRAKGVSVDVLRGPLRHLQANSLGESADVHQMIHQIATRLGVALKPPQDYSRQLDAVIRTKAGKPPQEKPAPRSKSVSASTDTTAVKQGQTSVPQPGSSVSYDESAEVLARTTAKQMFPKDFSTQAYFLGQQREAIGILRRGAPSGFPADVYAAIEAEAARDFPDDFHTRLYVIRKQMEDYNKLNG